VFGTICSFLIAVCFCSDVVRWSAEGTNLDLLFYEMIDEIYFLSSWDFVVGCCFGKGLERERERDERDERESDCVLSLSRRF